MSSFARILLILAIVAMVAAAPLGLANAQSSPPQSGELLTNPGFEAPFGAQGVANGWQPWYVTPDNVNYPATCGNSAPQTCKPYGVPSYHPAQPQDQRVPRRSISGNAQKWGSSYYVYIAGVYQQVSGITPGARLHFSAYTQAFNCSNDLGCFGSAGNIGLSYEAGANNLRVGIDPTGGTDPFSSNIVWSSYANPLDAYVQQTVEAVAQANTATVFVWSAPQYPEKHLETYVDNASLTVVGQGPAPTTAPTQSAQATPPAGTPAPRPTIPAGTTTYTVVAGDTLAAIALRFNLTLDQLLALNPSITNPSAIQVGQVVNVAGQAPTQAATPAPANTPAPTATSQPTAAPTQTPVASTTAATAVVGTPPPTLVASNLGLCLQAFADLNGNSVRDTGEALLPGVKFDIQSESGQTTTYTTGNQQEPYCMSNLPDGRYTISATVPSGQVATTDTRWAVSLLSGTSVNIALGLQPSTTPTVQPTVEPTATLAAEIVKQPTNSSIPLALLGGGTLMILAVVALFFGLRSRNKSA